MEKKKEFLSAQLGWRKLLSIALLVGVFFSLIEIFFAGDFIAESFARKVEFSTRQFLNKDPILDPRLKLFAIDDKTASALQSEDLTPKQWASLIRGIKERKPKAIFVDKIFTLYNGTQEDAQNFINAFSSNIPVYAGSFGIGKAIAGRPELSTKKFGINAFDFFAPEVRPSDVNNTTSVLMSIPWFPKVTDQLHFYGPAEPILPAFRKLGHINTLENAHIAPFLWPDYKNNKTEFIVPHLAFLASDEIVVDKNYFFVNGQKIKLDRKNSILVNLNNSKAIYQRIFSIKSFLSQIEKEEAISKIQEGDVVVVIKDLSTGNTDLLNTPLGRIPGSFIVISLLNSILKNEWLQPFNYEIELIWIGTILGALIASFLWQNGIWICLILLPLIFATAGLISFVYYNVMFSWVLPGIAGTLTGIIILAERFRSFHANSIRLKESLRKMLPEKRLAQILKNPSSLQLEPAEKVVSLMFIDIVGFSLSAEGHSPKDIFSELKQFFKKLRKTIHDHGGVVDKSLGDGLLCFFGYNYERSTETLFQANKTATQNHAEQAFRCAIQIQKDNLQDALSRFTAGKPIYPLRVGINTATVYVGDLGDEESLDFTIIGHGVNYAKRFEESCELFKIMMSPTTKLLLSGTGGIGPLVNDIKLRYLKTKHHSEPLEAYEYNPFLNEDENLHKALDAYSEASGLHRKEARFPVPNSLAIAIHSTLGEGQLLDFSLNGLSIKLDHYFARGVELPLFVGGQSGKLYEKLSAAGLLPLIGEVRWGKIEQGSHIHGLLLRNLNQTQKYLLFNMLREHIEQHSAAA